MNSRFILTVAVEHLSYLLMGKNPSILSMSVISKSLVIFFLSLFFTFFFSHFLSFRGCHFNWRISCMWLSACIIIGQRKLFVSDSWKQCTTLPLSKEAPSAIQLLASSGSCKWPQSCTKSCSSRADFHGWLQESRLAALLLQYTPDRHPVWCREVAARSESCAQKTWAWKKISATSLEITFVQQTRNMGG